MLLRCPGLNSVLFLLVLDGEIAAGGPLVLVADVVGDGLVLGLLGRGLVALLALAKHLFLHEIDGLAADED